MYKLLGFPVIKNVLFSCPYEKHLLFKSTPKCPNVRSCYLCVVFVEHYFIKFIFILLRVYKQFVRERNHEKFINDVRIAVDVSALKPLSPTDKKFENG